jgi:3-hydroxybutyryl-CoA dehydrogenase
MILEDIKTVLIIGSGTMGQQIGFQCAVSGFDVMMYDIAEDMLKTADKRLDKLVKAYIAGGRLADETAAAARAKIQMTTDAQAAG